MLRSGPILSDVYRSSVECEYFSSSNIIYNGWSVTFVAHWKKFFSSHINSYFYYINFTYWIWTVNDEPQPSQQQQQVKLASWCQHSTGSSRRSARCVFSLLVNQRVTQCIHPHRSIDRLIASTFTNRSLNIYSNLFTFYLYMDSSIYSL